MQRVKMQNPGPLSLVTINPKRSKGMPAKRKASTTRSRKARASSSKRRPNTARVSSSRHTSALRTTPKRKTKRRSNPAVHASKKRYTRRRNPIGGGLREAIPLVGSGIAIGFVLPVVNRFVGALLPFGQFNAPITTIGTGYGLGWIASKFAFTRRFQNSLEVAGLVLGITQIVTPLVARFGNASAPAQGMSGTNRGMRGIAAVPSVPPQLNAMPAAAKAAGMKGIASYQAPGRFGR